MIYDYSCKINFDDFIELHYGVNCLCSFINDSMN